MPIFALVDCDAFFCNCERLFKEELRHTPVIVLSNNDGCAVSRTKEAKALGIEMGAPYFKIRELCEKKGVAVFSSNFSLYTNISSRVMKILKTFAPRVEVYSVDEGFLDLTGVADPEKYCREIKTTVEQFVGIPVSIGIGPTKGLCKAACFLAKKDQSQKGIVSLLDSSVQDFALNLMPIEKLWGVAQGRGMKLRLAGIKTAKEFRDYKNDRYIQEILTKVGRMIQDELRGIVCFPISEIQVKKKEIMSSRTFGNPVSTKQVIAESIATHASEVAEELRSQNSVCKAISIFIRSNPYNESSPQYGKSALWKFETATADTFKIINGALECLDIIYKSGIEYRKSGVRVIDLQNDDEYELNLFSAPDNEKERTLMKMLDKINKREGPRTILSMACGVNNKDWRMNRNFKSPRYVSSWDELPEVF